MSDAEQHGGERRRGNSRLRWDKETHAIVHEGAGRIAQLEAEVARLTATLAQARGAIEAFFLPAHGCGEPSKFPHPYEPMHHTWNAKLDLLHATLVVLSGLSK